MALATSTILGLLAAGAGAAGSAEQGEASKRQMDFQQRVASQQADSERQVAANQESDYRKAQSSRIAQIRAALGASGTDTSTGTAPIAFGDFAGEAERNALRIRSGGDIRSSRLDQQAAFYGKAGDSAQQAGYARAGSSLLSGIGNSFSTGR